MIRLERGNLRVTSALATAARDLASLSDAAAADYANQPGVERAWLAQRDDMVIEQHRKCGWCETPLDNRMVEMDHIRPKSRAMYWWLAFDLRNLLAACRSCNNAKRDKWPIASGARRLEPRDEPWAVQEQAEMLDPTIEDPLPHIAFLYEGGEWRIAGATPRGRITVRNLELDRDYLRSNLNDYAARWLDPLAVDLHNALRTGDRLAYDAAARRLVALTEVRVPWSAFHRAYLRHILSP